MERPPSLTLRVSLGIRIARDIYRTQRTVPRAGPCLFGLYSLVTLWYAALPERDRENLKPTWTGKTTVTFSDAITLVRRDLSPRSVVSLDFYNPSIQWGRANQWGRAKTHPHSETEPLPHTDAGNVMAKVELRIGASIRTRPRLRP